MINGTIFRLQVFESKEWNNLRMLLAWDGPEDGSCRILGSWVATAARSDTVNSIVMNGVHSCKGHHWSVTAKKNRRLKSTFSTLQAPFVLCTCRIWLDPRDWLIWKFEPAAKPLVAKKRFLSEGLGVEPSVICLSYSYNAKIPLIDIQYMICFVL